MTEPLIGAMIFGLLVIWPVRRIFQRTGLNPNLSFVVLIPYLGLLLAAMILFHSRWPVLATDGGGRRTGGSGT